MSGRSGSHGVAMVSPVSVTVGARDQTRTASVPAIVTGRPSRALAMRSIGPLSRFQSMSVRASAIRISAPLVATGKDERRLIRIALFWTATRAHEFRQAFSPGLIAAIQWTDNN